MAINLTDKIHVVSDNIPTKNLGSALANSGRDAVSVQEIIDLVPAPAGPESGFFTPELSLSGMGSFSSITYGTRWGYYTVINNIVTVSYSIKISTWSISKAPGATLIPYITLPFSFPSVLSPNYPYVHSIGYNRNISKTNNLNGGETVGSNGTAWSYRQTSGAPPTTLPITDTDISSYAALFLVSGTVTYVRQSS
jgi:hypothetical protein